MLQVTRLVLTNHNALVRSRVNLCLWHQLIEAFSSSVFYCWPTFFTFEEECETVWENHICSSSLRRRRQQRRIFKDLRVGRVRQQSVLNVVNVVVVPSLTHVTFVPFDKHLAAPAQGLKILFKLFVEIMFCFKVLIPRSRMFCVLYHMSRSLTIASIEAH